MKILFTENGWDDYHYWQANDKKLIQRINDLIKDIQRSPFDGLGKPEALRFSLKGYWSRRINQEHRLVYKIQDNCICILQCRYHYQ